MRKKRKVILWITKPVSLFASPRAEKTITGRSIATLYPEGEVFRSYLHNGRIGDGGRMRSPGPLSGSAGTKPKASLMPRITTRL